MKNLFEYTSVPWIRYSSYECNFHALLVMVQMCFSFMLMNKGRDMHMCKHCKKAFVASRKGNEFYSQKCKNRFNVCKSRAKKKGRKNKSLIA